VKYPANISSAPKFANCGVRVSEPSRTTGAPSAYSSPRQLVSGVQTIGLTIAPRSLLLPAIPASPMSRCKRMWASSVSESETNAAL
jgi:hypothetical protein